MMFRLCAAGFALLLVLVSWLAVGRWCWYGDEGLKHKYQCALQLQTIHVDHDKISRAFFITLAIVLLLFASIDALKEYGEVLFPVEEHDSEVRINWRCGNCSWERPTANCARNCWRCYCCQGWECWTQCEIFKQWRSHIACNVGLSWSNSQIAS